MLGITPAGDDPGPLPPVRGPLTSGGGPGSPGSLVRRMVAVGIDITVAVVWIVGPLVWVLDPLLDAVDPSVEQGGSPSG